MFPYKVCCIKTAEEAEMAIEAGALAVGLVGEMPSGPGPIPDDDIKDIASRMRDRYGEKIWTTLLTSRTEADAIVDHVAYTGVNTVQIVDEPAPGAYEQIRKAMPQTRIIKVIHVEGEEAIDHARRAEDAVDIILLDSGKPNAAVKTLGGTGDTHDWSVSRRIVEDVGKPVFLAGGLRPDNVVDAIKQVGPYGVDICSGLRDDRYYLVQDKLRDFAARLQR